MKDKFAKLSLTEFWALLRSSEPRLINLAKEAEKALMPFPTTYLCESAFSMLAFMKKDRRNRLDSENDIQCALSKIEPDIEEPVREHQGHRSY